MLGLMNYSANSAWSMGAQSSSLMKTTSLSIKETRLAVEKGSKITILDVEPISGYRVKTIVTVMNKNSIEINTKKEMNLDLVTTEKNVSIDTVLLDGKKYSKIKQVLTMKESSEIEKILPGSEWIQEDMVLPKEFLDQYILELVKVLGAAEQWSKVSDKSKNLILKFKIRGSKLNSNANSWFGKTGTGMGDASVTVDKNGRIVSYRLSGPKLDGGVLEVTYKYGKFPIKKPEKSITKSEAFKVLIDQGTASPSWSQVSNLSAECDKMLVGLRKIENLHVDGSTLSKELIDEIGSILENAKIKCNGEELLELQRKELDGYLSGAKRG